MSLPCGANLDFGAITDATSDLKSTITSQLGGNFTSATALKSAVEGKLTTVTSGLSSLVPEIPELPALSLQTELTSLAAFDLTNPLGILDYQSKLTSITENFGDALSSSGFNLDTIVSQVAPSISSATDALSGLTSGGDVCELCPNFKLPSGATEAIQEASNPKLSALPAIKEEFTEFTANVDFNAQFDEMTTKLNKIAADPDVQAKISSDVSTGFEQISADIEGGITDVTEAAQPIIKEVAPVLEELSGKSLSIKLPKKFPL